MPRTFRRRRLGVLVKLLTALAQLVYAGLCEWKQRQAARRAAAVRADPAGEWMRKFGGTDERSTTSTENARSDSDK